MTYRKNGMFPAWVEYFASIRRRISAIAPAYASMLIQLFARYLGIFVGPDAYLHQFHLPLRKLQDKVSKIRSAGLGWCGSAWWYRSRALPTVAYRI